ncbi:mycofactocin-coupled SDR family oxidoreductase [Rhodococcus wratislaviensis]|uniref:mycofactocin-coupled SDR family oxidoreductase n=1 Tax=Rhodococcus wratislaviensis TaxID=44752 RepID=UPI00365338D1
MGGRLEGKVAVVTGAARGQGRSHAIRLAEEGADIIAIDLCDQIDSVGYPLGSNEDLAFTAEQVEKLDRRVVTKKADVRSREQLCGAIDQGVAKLGRLDIVVANAGILPAKGREPSAFVDAMDVDFGGVMNLVSVSLPHLSEGASIITIGSLAALIPGAVQNPRFGPGGTGYGLAKKMVVQYTETLASILAAMSIRVNVIHPTNCDTNLIHNEDVYKVYRPDLENPTREDVEPAFYGSHGIPIPYIDPVDISNAVVYLASDESRYVTGIELRVDAGSLLKVGAR